MAAPRLALIVVPPPKWQFSLKSVRLRYLNSGEAHLPGMGLTGKDCAQARADEDFPSSAAGRISI